MTTFSQIIDNVASLSRDSSSATAAIIQTFLKQVLDEIQGEVEFPSTKTSLDLTTGTGAYVEFSAYNIKTYDILDIRDPDGAHKTVPIIEDTVFDRLVPKQDTATGYPQVARVKSDEQLYIYPYGTSTTWTVKYHDRLSTFSVASQTCDIPPLGIKAVTNGVLAEILDWKDDDRATRYLAKYSRDMSSLKKMFRKHKNTVMQPGVQHVDNSDYNRIFGA